MGYVRQNSLVGQGESTFAEGIASRMGFGVALDFYTYMVLAGAAYQVRAGTITTPLIGDVVITDTAAEMCADCVAGTCIMPVYLNIGVRLGGGTLHEYAAKSVATVSSAGTAFTPLPLRSNGAAAVTTARVSAAGGVTVTGELATTTLRHWNWANPVAVGAGNEPDPMVWEPRCPPVLVGARCFYVQIAATTTGPSYYANFDYFEVPTATLL